MSPHFLALYGNNFTGKVKEIRDGTGELNSVGSETEAASVSPDCFAKFCLKFSETLTHFVMVRGCVELLVSGYARHNIAANIIIPIDIIGLLTRFYNTMIKCHKVKRNVTEQSVKIIKER